MNLFIIHQFPDLDNLAPIINTLLKKNNKVTILSLNLLYDFKKYKLFRYLIKNKNLQYLDLHSLSLKYFALKQILNLINLLPNFMLKKFIFFFQFIYYDKFNFFSEKIIEKVRERKEICSINVDEALIPKAKFIINNYCKKKMFI